MDNILLLLRLAKFREKSRIQFYVHQCTKKSICTDGCRFVPWSQPGLRGLWWEAKTPAGGQSLGVYPRGPGQPALADPPLSRGFAHAVCREAICPVIVCENKLQSVSKLSSLLSINTWHSWGAYNPCHSRGLCQKQHTDNGRGRQWTTVWFSQV